MGGAEAALAEYKKVDVDARVESATPHQLVQMLFDALMKNLTIAKIGARKNDYYKRSEGVSKATAIVMELSTSLDLENGGEIASSLADLYDYMRRLLMTANIRGNEGAIEEVISLAKPLKEAWEALPEEVKR